MDNKKSIDLSGLAVFKEENDKAYQPVGNYVTEQQLTGKVDKVTGKDLSTNDYTNEDKAKVAVALTQHQDISGKVDKETGKGLSTNDYTNEEKQKVADALVLADIAGKANASDVYTKEETYSKTEVNDLITTPNQEYVSVTSTAQTTAVTDLLPATGAADTIYRVGNWDGTQYNDSVYSEYTWNGSAYIKLSTKSQVGEVYDISANHADTKYANLAAALGANGANVPQSLRKGGMSVKFVQSSDNKYVQYRLMSDSFNTTVTNWQGVDEVFPEYNDYSKNIILGRSVKQYVDDRLAYKAGKIGDYFIHQNWLQNNGKYLNVETCFDYKCICIPVKNTDVIKIVKAVLTNTYCAFLTSLDYIDIHNVNFYDAPLCSGTSRIEISSNTETTLTVPNDAVYLYIGMWNGQDCSPSFLNINGYDCLTSVKEQIVELQSIRESLLEYKVLPTNDWKNKQFSSSSGTDAIFFDKRNKISSKDKLFKIGVRAYSSGTVKIHYLSTAYPYSEIANEIHEVSAGINEFYPTAHLDYTQEMYVAFSNVEGSSPGIMLKYPTDGTGQSVKKFISDGHVVEQDYPYALWIYTEKNKIQNLEIVEEIEEKFFENITLPSSDWREKNFNSSSGNDGIFWDTRNLISDSVKLVKIHLKCTNAGTVVIHYLSTDAPYNDILTQTCEVSDGVNDIDPSPLLDYTVPMYVGFQNTNNTGVGIKYPTDGTGRAKKKFINDGHVVDQDYPYALWIDVVKVKELSDNKITTLNQLKSAIANNVANIEIGETTITLDSTIQIPTGTKITGVRGKSIINVPSTVLKGFEMNNKTDIVIENLTIVGAYNGTPLKNEMQPVKSGILDGIEYEENSTKILLPSIGYQTDLINGGVTSNYVPQIGINIYQCEKLEIIGCEIKNFSYYGICNGLSGKNYRYACKFENNYINNCYCGIYLYNEAERSQYIANNVSLCQIGLFLDSGTNMFTDCAFSANRIGMLMNNGVNHAHGAQTGNSFTHCSLFSVYANNVEYGEVFSQCKFGYVDDETGNAGNAIVLKNSRGLSFNNCQMIACSIKFDGKFNQHYSSYSIDSADVFGNTPYVVTYTDISGQASQYNGGVNQILGCSYISGSGNISISSDLDATNVIMKNNFFITGQDSTGLNN